MYSGNGGNTIKREVSLEYVLGDIFSEAIFRVMFVDKVNLGRTRLFQMGSLDSLTKALEGLAQSLVFHYTWIPNIFYKDFYV